MASSTVHKSANESGKTNDKSDRCDNRSRQPLQQEQPSSADTLQVLPDSAQNASPSRRCSNTDAASTFLLANVSEKYGNSIFSSSDAGSGLASSSPATAALLTTVAAASAAGGGVPSKAAVITAAANAASTVAANGPSKLNAEVNKLPSFRALPQSLGSVSRSTSQTPVPCYQRQPLAPSPTPNTTTVSSSLFNNADYERKSSKGSGGSCCPKQHQLPMFLSKTYHMIDRCDPEIATWSAQGDSFVVKNVEKFSAAVLPQYFKHSNFSSFARQLNFYGFRKLKAEPILTADFDARTASYVRFYHEKFQRNKPELLQGIRRATKSDQQSKDDIDGLREEINSLRECLANAASEYDRKLSEVVENNNRKINQIWNEVDSLSKRFLASRTESNGISTTEDASQPHHATPTAHTTYAHHVGQPFGSKTGSIHAIPLAPPPSTAYVNPQQAALPSMHTVQLTAATAMPAPSSVVPDMMQSLSHIAGVKLLSPSVKPQQAAMQPLPMPLTESATSGTKRGAPSSETVCIARKRVEGNGEVTSLSSKGKNEVGGGAEQQPTVRQRAEL